MLFLRVLRPSRPSIVHCPEAAESLQSHRLHSTTNDKRAFQRYFATSAVPSPIFQVNRVRTERVPPTAVTSAEFATNLTLPRKAPKLGPIKKIKVVDPSIIYVKDATGTTLVELDVELTVD